MTTAADLLIDTISDWGVKVVFGIPGDGINGIVEALRKRKDSIRFIQTRHEEAAAFMACGYAKFTGRLGVCLATSGPGGIHLLNGLYDAKMDGAPVLALTGLQYHDLINTRTQQDVELDKLYMDVALYNSRIMSGTHVGPVADLACRTALSRRGVSHLTMPVDLQSVPVDGALRSKRNVPGHTSDVFARGASLPEESSLKRAAAILNEGRRVAILAGQGALGARELLEELADRLAGPIIKPLLGRAVVPDDSPFTTGAVGLLGTAPSQEAIERCDTLLMIGSSFPYVEYLPKPGQARGVQIDLDPTRIGLRYPVEEGLVGDCRRTLELLLPLLKKKEDRSFLDEAQRGMKKWWELMRDQGERDGAPLKPQRVAWEIGKRLPPDAVVTCDSGTVATWWARHIPVRQGQMHAISGNLASMACGLPYAIAAQIAYPSRTVLCFVGDGAFSMLMAEFATAVKYGLPIKVVVLKNNSLGQIKWEQMVFLGNPEYGCDLHPIDFAKFAEACGGEGIRAEKPEDCAAGIERLLAARGPALLEATVDPHVPPMPPKIEMDQARKFAESLVRGEPYRGKILKTVVADKVRELV